MDIGKQKLRKWASLLLDTGKRSNLISFKDSKSSTVEVLSPSPDELFVKIQKDATFEVFDPRLYGQLLEEPAEENSGEDLFSENPAPAPVKKPADRKTAFMELYQKKSETARKNEILVSQKFCNRATKAFVALAHQMPSSFRNSWSRFTDSVLQRLIPRGVITEVVFTQSNHSRT